VSGKKLYDSNFNQVADSLRIPRDRVREALDAWQPAHLVTWLEQFPAEVYKPGSERLRLFEQHLASATWPI
jgi:hypothetical protein